MTSRRRAAGLNMRLLCGRRLGEDSLSRGLNSKKLVAEAIVLVDEWKRAALVAEWRVADVEVAVAVGNSGVDAV